MISIIVFLLTVLMAAAAKSLQPGYHQARNAEERRQKKDYIPRFNLAEQYTPHPATKAYESVIDEETGKETRHKVTRPNQQQFHETRWTSKYRGVFTGYGGGKTMCGVAEVLYWAFNYPGSIGWAGEPDYGMNDRILIPMFKRLLGLDEADELVDSPLVRKYNKTRHKIIWYNGSVTWLGSCEKPEKIVGGSWDYFYLDEAFEIRHFDVIWNVLTSRLRGSGKLPNSQKPGGWVTTTPTPRGTPLYYKFADPIQKHPNAKEFHWYQTDNYDLDEDYLQDQDLQHKLQTDRDLFIYGRWADLGIGSYQYDYRLHVLGPDNILELTEPPPRDEWRFVVFGVDFGWKPNPMAVVAIVFDKQMRAYVVEEWVKTGAKREEIVEACQGMRERWGDRSTYNIFWCDKSEPRLIAALVEAGLDARKNVTEREDGIREMGGRFLRNDDSRPMIYFAKECEKTLEEVAVYEIEHKVDDHCMDAIRYAIINSVDYRESKKGWMKAGKSSKRRKGQSYFSNYKVSRRWRGRGR